MPLTHGEENSRARTFSRTTSTGSSNTRELTLGNKSFIVLDIAAEISGTSPTDVNKQDKTCEENAQQYTRTF